jgi:cyclopropane fatty-acyl-phospholipid synthase-like methyltransferase
MVGQRYFDKKYWTTGKVSGYTPTNYNREDYMNEAKASFLTTLYGGEGKWLEAGCAFGWTVECLCKLGVDACGFDISKYAVKNSPDELDGRIKCSDGLDRGLWDEEEFDILVSFETAEHVHISNVDTWLGNLVYWLKPGGKVLMTICLGNDNIRGLDDNDKSHQTLQPRIWWEDKLENLGLVISQETFDKAHSIVVNTEEMQIRGEPENIVQKYGLHVFAWRKPDETD